VNLDHTTRCQFDPVWNLPPIGFLSTAIFKPSLQVREVSESKESGIAFLLCGPDGISGEAGIRDEKPNAKIGIFSTQATDQRHPGRLVTALVALHLPCDDNRADICRGGFGGATGQHGTELCDLAVNAGLLKLETLNGNGDDSFVSFGGMSAFRTNHGSAVCRFGVSMSELGIASGDSPLLNLRQVERRL